ncbi:MAG: hypothetical protein KGO85_02860 [Proteobacteria bacterium]|jgi:hypothetical protein|nr:hypothetical protein [Pseudomonadota bacterium]
MALLAEADLALNAVKLLLALSLLLQCMEDRKIINSLGVLPFGSWALLGHDLKAGWPQCFKALAWLFEARRLSYLVAARAFVALFMLLSAALAIYVRHQSNSDEIALLTSSPWAIVLSSATLISAGIVVLWMSQVFWMIRWRGTLNGGSDAMSLSLLNALMLGEICRFGLPLADIKLQNIAAQLSLWFIVIQSLSSYVVSGAIKLRDPNWRNGLALTHFLDASVHGPLKSTSLFRTKGIARLASWGFTLWECAMPLLLLHPYLAVMACLAAFGFHSMVLWYFGLNRFLWAWSSCFPALIYAAFALKSMS